MFNKGAEPAGKIKIYHNLFRKLTLTMYQMRKG